MSFTHSSVIPQTTECGGREETLPAKGVLQTLSSSQASILVNKGPTVTITSFATSALIFLISLSFPQQIKHQDAETFIPLIS